MTKKKSKNSSKKLLVNTNSFVGSQYSQMVGLTVTDDDITLEFIHINPRDKTRGEVVSRVTLPFIAGEILAETIKNTLIKHKEKK